MSFDLAKIIATAWAAERRKWVIEASDPCGIDSLYELWNSDGTMMTNTEESCQAHLDQLCATAVLTAIREVGMSIIDREQFKFWVDGGDDYADIPLAAAPPLGER